MKEKPKLKLMSPKWLIVNAFFCGWNFFYAIYQFLEGRIGGGWVSGGLVVLSIICLGAQLDTLYGEIELEILKGVTKELNDFRQKLQGE